MEAEKIKVSVEITFQKPENLKYPYNRKGMTSRVIEARRFLLANVECTMAKPGIDENQPVKYCPNPINRKIRAETVTNLIINFMEIFLLYIYIINTI